MKNCKFCNKSFKPRKKTHVFCSRHCQSKWLAINHISGGKKQGVYLICPVCKKPFYIPQYRVSIAKYCSRNCLAKVHLAKYLPIYGFKKSGKPKRKYNLYTKTLDGRRIRTHRYVMEQHLARPLESWEHVHHIDGNTYNNQINNLVILTNSEHQKVEIEMRNN